MSETRAEAPSKQEFVGARLQLAREFNGLTQVALGQAAATSGAVVSYCENGVKRDPSEDLVGAFAEVLGFAPGFFYRPIIDGFREEECSFRHRRSTPERAKRKVRAHATLLGEVLHYLKGLVELPSYSVPEMSAYRSEPEVAAGECRNAWGIDGDAPLLTINRAVERAGVVVVNHFGDTAKVDAFSRRGAVNVIFLNRAVPSPSRWTFDVAHELGHLVMHPGVATGSVDTEREADQFASAFLLPRRPFAREFRTEPFTWSHIFQMKKRWRVSAAAIVRRAYELQLIGAVQYRRSFQYMSSHGWSKQEPYEPEFHEPELLEAAIRTAHKHHGLTLDSLSVTLGYDPTTLEEVVGIPIPRGTPRGRVMGFPAAETR